MKKIIFIVLLIIFLGTNNMSAQWAILKSDADSLILKGADYIYNCQFDNASETFNEVIERYPNNPAGYFLDAMIEWWKITTYRDSHDYDNLFLKKIDRVIKICDDILAKNSGDIGGLFFKGGALGYRARYYVVRKSWFNAATDGYNAFKILLKSYEIASSNHDIMLGTGLYNYMAEYLPEEYPAIKPLIAFIQNGDKKLGLLQLKAAAKYARYSSVEAKIALLQIYYEFEKDYPTALAIAKELHLLYPNNSMIHRYYGRVLVTQWYLNEFEKQWREMLIRYINKQPGYDVGTAREALYYIGYALMTRGKYDMALKYFYKCDEACRMLDDKPSGFMILTNLKIADIYYRLKKNKLARKQCEKVLKWDDYKGSRNAARELIKKLK